MKKRILSLVLSLCICATASLASCGSRSDSESGSDDSASNSSVSDSAGDSNGGNSGATSESSNASDVIESSGNVKIVWTSTADAEGDIDIFTAKFKVADGAASGLSEVSIGRDIIIADASYKNLSVETVAGGVDVGGSDAESSAPAGAAIVVETKGANAGDEVEVVVKLVNVDVCTAIGFELLFDAEVLEFVDITPSSTLDACGQLVYNVM